MIFWFLIPLCVARFHTVQISRNDNSRRLTVVLGIVLVTGKPLIHWFLFIDRLGRVMQGRVMWGIY